MRTSSVLPSASGVSPSATRPRAGEVWTRTLRPSTSWAMAMSSSLDAAHTQTASDRCSASPSSAVTRPPLPLVAVRRSPSRRKLTGPRCETRTSGSSSSGTGRSSQTAAPNGGSRSPETSRASLWAARTAHWRLMSVFPQPPVSPADATPPPDGCLAPVAVVDIDGVVADVRHRVGRLQRRPPDWVGFFAAADRDAPLAAGVDRVLDLIAAGHEIVWLTGRPEWLRGITERWLDEQGLPVGMLL